MEEYGVRGAIGIDVPRLAELFAASFAQEGQDDSLMVPLGGDWAGYIRQLFRVKTLRLMVYEQGGRVEGYALARTQVMTGPMVRRSIFRKLLGGSRPRPIMAPYRAVWVDDFYVTPEGLAAGVSALSRGVKAWATHLKAHRIGASICANNPAGDEFIRSLGMQSCRAFYTVDL